MSMSMTSDNLSPVEELPLLDPTDDEFDGQYMAYLEVMSVQMKSTSMFPDDRTSAGDTHDVGMNSSTISTGKRYSVPPEVMQAILM